MFCFYQFFLLVLIKVGFHIKRMTKNDVRNMNYQIEISCRVNWNDTRLQWNDHQHSELNTRNLSSLLLFHSDQVWVPKLTFGPLVEMKEVKNFMQSSSRLRIHPKGEILYSGNLDMIFNCKMDLSNFPFDIQNCYFFISACKFIFIFNLYKHIELLINLKIVFYFCQKSSFEGHRNENGMGFRRHSKRI